MAERLFTTPKIDFSKPIDTSLVNGKTAIVTGGAQGIGLGVSSALAKAGAFVVIVDLKVEEGELAARSLRDLGYNCQFMSADVTSYESQLAVFKATNLASPTSSIGIVVPCAGIPGNNLLASLADLSPDDDPPAPPVGTMDVDLYGVFYTVYLAVHFFRKQVQKEQGEYRPQILFVASLAGYADLPLNCNYAAAKFGVRGLFKAVRGCSAELGGLRCNLLAPTFIRTPFTESVIPGILKANMKVGDVEDVVEGAMRCLCDTTVDGRAVCIAPGTMNGGEPGTANFDLCDDLLGYDAGREMLEHSLQGTLGNGFADFCRITKQSRETNAWKSYR